MMYRLHLLDDNNTLSEELIHRSVQSLAINCVWGFLRWYGIPWDVNLIILKMKDHYTYIQNNVIVLEFSKSKMLDNIYRTHFYNRSKTVKAQCRFRTQCLQIGTKRTSLFDIKKLGEKICIKVWLISCLFRTPKKISIYCEALIENDWSI